MKRNTCRYAWLDTGISSCACAWLTGEWTMRPRPSSGKDGMVPVNAVTKIS